MTYAINTTTGLDVFYNVRPSIIGDKAFAVSHNVGIGFRKNIFMLNLEYVFGNYPIGEYINSKPTGTEINHARISFGLKF